MYDWQKCKPVIILFNSVIFFNVNGGQVRFIFLKRFVFNFSFDVAKCVVNSPWILMLICINDSPKRNFWLRALKELLMLHSTKLSNDKNTRH
jgi:hypothetical protein